MKKILKFIVITVLLVVGIAVVFTLAFTKNHKEITMIRSVEVNAPQDQVFNYIVHTENKAEWLSDPNEKIERTTTGTPATVGFSRTWKIENPPEKGSETIIKIENGKSIETKIENNLNGQQANGIQLLSCEVIDNNHTKIVWQKTSDIPLGFMARMLLGISEKLAKSTDSQQAYNDGIERGLEKEGMYKDMDNALQRLKEKIEEKNNF